MTRCAHHAGRAAAVALGATLVTSALAACTASVNLTVDADSLADKVATALQEEVGSDAPPHMDCGDEPVDIVVNETVVCALSVDGEDAVYDTIVTITAVDGTSYDFSVDVADTPR
ncbi:DUF4333 domain-containing protein [Demequina subtropica]|uniref:DUF4333 domain-containing protein n=1 Tax=Demequina subtropica TaxID=1638989 RepID=UPI0007808827|nr:DUF4333 domain-containing protein [Demequina subtropica]